MNIEYEWMYVIIQYYLYMNVNAYRGRELYLRCDLSLSLTMTCRHCEMHLYCDFTYLEFACRSCVFSLMRIVAKYCLLRIYCVYVSLKPS